MKWKTKPFRTRERELTSKGKLQTVAGCHMAIERQVWFQGGEDEIEEQKNSFKHPFDKNIALSTATHWK